MTTGLLQAPAGAQACVCRRNAFKGRTYLASKPRSRQNFACSTLHSGAHRLAGQPLRASRLQTAQRQQQLEVVRCQAVNDKKTVAITGMWQSAAPYTVYTATTSYPICKTIHAGATGLIGSRLAARLSSQGHTVRVLTRNVNKARNKLQYARLQFYNTQQLQEAVRGADAVINLAG